MAAPNPALIEPKCTHTFSFIVAPTGDAEAPGTVVERCVRCTRTRAEIDASPPPLSLLWSVDDLTHELMTRIGAVEASEHQLRGVIRRFFVELKG